MQVSQFEIHRLVQRTLEALGAGYGVDRDAARAVAWLEAHGFPGLPVMDVGLADLEAGIRPPKLQSVTTPGELMIDAGGASTIGFGSAAVDLLLARAVASGKGQVGLHLCRCRSPLFLIPVAVENSAEAAFSLAWETGHGGIEVRVEADHAATVFSGSGGNLRAALSESGESEVDIRVAPVSQGFSPPRSGMVAVLKPDDLARQFAQSLDGGVAVDPAIWRRIDAVAARVQVPASEESRRKGAGGGDANA
jgi:hypothetical protein